MTNIFFFSVRSYQKNETLCQHHYTLKEIDGDKCRNSRKKVFGLAVLLSTYSYASLPTFHLVLRLDTKPRR